jgi:hypothetical protein
VTAWRWRKRGWLKTVNIAGRPYLTDKALAGEFAKEHKTPNRFSRVHKSSPIGARQAGPSLLSF